MPELLVMRHAKSDWSTQLPDFDRPLSKRGHRDAPRMAEWLADNDLAPDAIITSAANRALTTARYVADHFGFAETDVEVQEELYLASADTWLETLHEQVGDHRLLICGHNPGLDALVEFLSADAPGYTTDDKLMTTAAVAVLAVESWSALGARSAALVELVRPTELP